MMRLHELVGEPMRLAKELVWAHIASHGDLPVGGAILFPKLESGFFRLWPINM